MSSDTSPSEITWMHTATTVKIEKEKETGDGRENKKYMSLARQFISETSHVNGMTAKLNADKVLTIFCVINSKIIGFEQMPLKKSETNRSALVFCFVLFCFVWPFVASICVCISPRCNWMAVVAASKLNGRTDVIITQIFDFHRAAVAPTRLKPTSNL